MRNASPLLPLILLVVGVAALGVGPARAGEPESPGALVILAQTDSRGEVRPCHCPGNPAGGLSRRSGVIERVRRGLLPSLIVDGGDFLPAPGDTLEEDVAAFMVQAMELIEYQAVAVGEFELFRGVAFLREAADRLPLVCANLRLGGDDPPVIPRVRWIDRDGRRIAVTAILDPLLYYQWPGAFDRPPEAMMVLDAAEALEQLRTELADADLVVLLSHADLATSLGLARGAPWIDVMVQGHEPELGHRVDRVEGDRGPLVVEPGPRSRQVAKLTVVPGAEGWEATGFQILDLKLATQEDRRIDALLEAFEAGAGGR